MNVTLNNPRYVDGDNFAWPVFEAEFTFDGGTTITASFPSEPRPLLLINGVTLLQGKTIADMEFLASLPPVLVGHLEYQSAIADPDIFQWFWQYTIDLREDKLMAGPVELREISGEEASSLNAVLQTFR